MTLQTKNNKQKDGQIAEFHALYEKIHPFSDGNGRTGRLLMSFQCIQNDRIPPLIESENRKGYLECLEAIQLNNDIAKFVTFLEHCQKRSLGLITINKEQFSTLDALINQVSKAKEEIMKDKESKNSSKESLDNNFANTAQQESMLYKIAKNRK